MDRAGYQSLVVWQRSRALAIEVYRQTQRGLIAREWALRDQMRRAAVSVPSNIAEGSARGTHLECAQFLRIAKGSLAELATQADIAHGIGLLDPEISNQWQRECRCLSSMLRSLMDHHRRATL
jgi:four helix bundle protein